jgi:hypothetical protein
MLRGIRTSIFYSSFLCLGVGRGLDSGVTAFTTGYLLIVQAVQIQGVINVTTKQKFRWEDVFRA